MTENTEIQQTEETFTDKNAYRDMTTGSPIRHILAFAVPMFIGNIFQQFYSIVDTMVAGYNIGDEAIAAIGATSSLYGLIISLACGLSHGYAIVVTQAFGSHDTKRLKSSIAGMIKLNVYAAILLTVLSLLFLKPILRLMNTPEAIFPQALLYIQVICAGIPATLAYNTFAGILEAFGNSKTALYFLIIASVTNIVLDIVLIMVFHLGVAGVAAATIIAQALAAVLCGIYVIKKYRKFLPSRKDFAVSSNLMWNIFTTGFAMAMMYCVVDMGSVLFQSANNKLGYMYITAHTAARRIIVVMMNPLGTIATAFATFTGQNYGAKRFDRIRSTMKKVLLLEAGWGIGSWLLILLTGRFLIHLTTGTTDPDIIKNAVLSLNVHLPFYAPLGVLLCLRSMMQAMGQKAAPVISSSLELTIKIISAFYLVPKIGFIGTCITEPVTWIVCMIFLLIFYAIWHKRWQKNQAEL